MLHIENLTYRDPAAVSLQLSIDAFNLATGEHAIVLGPSGCGKSTLLHLIGAILTPQSGTIRVAGTDLQTLTPRMADRWRGKVIGFLPQKLALVPSLTARDNLLLCAYANGLTADRPRADALLTSLGIGQQAGSKPHQLSQGQRQRVAIARALFNRPQLLLADEPTANLDDAACAGAIRLLTAQATEIGASLVVATHDARVLSALPHATVWRLAGAAL